MTPAAKARMATYLTGAAGFGALILAGLGLADYDSTTGMLDLKPFNVYALAAAISTGLAVIVAPLALLKGWRK